MKKSIFTKLLGSFILFGILTVVTFVICIFLQASLLTGGNTNLSSPEVLIDEYGDVTDVEAVVKVGGWVEELDDNYNVITVYGKKRTTIQQYSTDDILEITSTNGKGEYVGFYIQRENVGKRFLVVYERDVMQININLIVNHVPGYADANIMWLFFPLLVLEIVFISLYLRKEIKKPLEKITEGLERLKLGDNSIRIAISAEAEFKEIVDTFNSMAEELQKEKVEKEDIISKKNQLLLELSHDIKTPIATIKSYANALEAGLVPEEKKEDYYHTIDIKADRVRALSDDMFMMLKMENSDYIVRLEKFDLCEYLRQLCAEYYDEITEAGFEFEINIPDREIYVNLDKGLFARVIGNLLTNARKYNQTGKKIAISCREDKEGISINVSDDGKKIPSELAEQMFSAFVRGDKTRKSDGGTGLGLAISKIIIDKHQGKISYKWVNEMNTFEINL